MKYAQYRILEWDSRWFGIPVGRVDLGELTVASAIEVDAWASENGLRCVYVYSDRASSCEIAGFELMDVRVEYEFDPLQFAKGTVDLSALICPEELESVCELAGRLFTCTRFARDWRFPVERVRDLYAEWVRCDNVNGNPGCLIMGADGDLAGFITGRKNPNNTSRGEIGLFGVEENKRRRGCGKQLLDLICRAFIPLGVERVSVVTQESNIAACNFYEGCGAQTISRGYWYHRWFDDSVSKRMKKYEI